MPASHYLAITGCQLRSKLRSRQPVPCSGRSPARSARPSLRPQGICLRSHLCSLRRSYLYILFISLFSSIRKVIEESITSCTGYCFPQRRCHMSVHPFSSAPDARPLTAAAAKSHRLMTIVNRPSWRFFYAPLRKSCENRENIVRKRCEAKSVTTRYTDSSKQKYQFKKTTQSPLKGWLSVAAHSTRRCSTSLPPRSSLTI